MIRLLAATLLLVGCSAATPPSASVGPSLSGPEVRARAACPPVKFTEECVATFLGFLDAGAGGVVCVWPDYRWTIVDADPAVALGEVGCGQDGQGMVTGVVE